MSAFQTFSRSSHKAQDGLDRAQILAELQREAPEGAAVEMTAWRASIQYPMGEVEFRSRPGWRRLDGNKGVAYQRPAPNLLAAHESALLIKSLLGKDCGRVVATVKLSFPEEGEAQRLVLLECHGVGLVLAMPRNGAVLAVGVDVHRLGSAAWLQKQLQRPLAQVAGPRSTSRFIYPGVVHQLKIVVERKGRRLRGTIYLDEDPDPLIPSFDLSRPSRLKPRLKLVPMHPVTVHAVSFEGQVRKR